MPIYEYQCTQCGHHLEKIQKFDEVPLTECPHCHKNALEKLISSAGFQLKGTGWYVTDFRDAGKNKKKEGKAPSKNSSDTASKPDKKDSK